MSETSTQVEAIFILVEPVLELLLAQGVSERVEVRELAHGVRVELVNASEGFLADGFLVVSEEEASELLALEEVFAVVLGLAHSEDVLVHVALVDPWLVELKLDR